MTKKEKGKRIIHFLLNDTEGIFMSASVHVGVNVIVMKIEVSIFINFTPAWTQVITEEYIAHAGVHVFLKDWCMHLLHSCAKKSII